MQQGGGMERERLAFCNLQMEFRKPFPLELKSYMEKKTISCWKASEGERQRFKELGTACFVGMKSKAWCRCLQGLAHSSFQHCHVRSDARGAVQAGYCSLFCFPEAFFLPKICFFFSTMLNLAGSWFSSRSALTGASVWGLETVCYLMLSAWC